MENGFYFVGFFKDVYTRQYTNSNNELRTNYSLILYRSFVSQFGIDQTEVTPVEVDIADFNRISAQVDSLKDNRVMVFVVPSARSGGRTGSWVRYWMPRGSEIKLLDKDED